MKKCYWAQNKVHYLGYIITEQGIATDPAKTKAIDE
jgi:hypothetical protein